MQLAWRDNVHCWLLEPLGWKIFGVDCWLLPCLVFESCSAVHTWTSPPVSASFWPSTTPPHFNFLDSLWALNPKWRARTHKAVLCSVSGLWSPNCLLWNNKSYPASVRSLAACGRFPLACCSTSSRFFAMRTSLDLLNSWSLNKFKVNSCHSSISVSFSGMTWVMQARTFRHLFPYVHKQIYRAGHWILSQV